MVNPKVMAEFFPVSKTRGHLSFSVVLNDFTTWAKMFGAGSPNVHM
jgi:hypothetical protein